MCTTINTATRQLALFLESVSEMMTCSKLRRMFGVLMMSSLLPVAGTACGDAGPTESVSLAGTYTATLFRVTPSGQSAIDVLAQGGSLSIAIASDNTTSGSLVLPASVAGSVFTASMAGTAVQSGPTVQFQQSADTFVRGLAFTVSGRALQASNQTVGTAAFTVTLTRQ